MNTQENDGKIMGNHYSHGIVSHLLYLMRYTCIIYIYIYIYTLCMYECIYVYYIYIYTHPTMSDMIQSQALWRTTTVLKHGNPETAVLSLKISNVWILCMIFQQYYHDIEAPDIFSSSLLLITLESLEVYFEEIGKNPASRWTNPNTSQLLSIVSVCKCPI